MQCSDDDIIKIKPLRCPYPYRAMLAICSDLDETPDRQTYWNIMRYLNTDQQTAIGKGVNLEVGNSIYFDMPANQFAYWNTDDTGRAMIRMLIKSGHIDCLHSFGDLAVTRKDAGRALSELDRYGCKLKVWIDHGRASTNFGSDIMQGHGCDPKHQAYHADLTKQFGITSIWQGRVTSVIGQEVSSQMKGLWTIDHPVASAKTIAKEWVKHGLGMMQDAKYKPHAKNRLIYPATLQDDWQVDEFMRANPHWKGVSSATNANGLGKVLTPKFLDTLIKRSAPCILYTHLGKVTNRDEFFDYQTRIALKALAARMADGELLVTTTSKMIDYFRMLRAVKITAENEHKTKKTIINIDTIHNPFGLSFKVPARHKAAVKIFVANKPVPFEFYRDKTKTLATVKIPWPELEFPEM